MARNTILIGAVALTHLFWHASSSSAQTAPATPPANTAVRVAVVKPERKAMRRVIEQPATIEPYEVAPLRFKISGYVDRVSVDIGDRIAGPELNRDGSVAKPGQSLAVLSVPEYEADVHQKESLVVQAQADIQQALAAVQVAASGVTSAEAQINVAQAAVSGGQAHVERYQSELKRFTELESRQSVTAKLVDETRAQLHAVQAKVDEARAQVRASEALVAERNARRAEADANVKAAEARSKVAQAELARANVLWEYRTLRAPFNGVVTQRHVHPGHLVQPGAAGEVCLVVARTDRVRVVVDVPEIDAASVGQGNAITIRFPALNGLSIDAKVVRTSWLLNSTARTLRAEADLENEPNRFRPGMYGYANIVVAERANALVLPASAVFADKSQSFVACLEDGKIQRRPVNLGLRDSNDVEVLSGLSGNEQVVRANAGSLVDGQPAQALPSP